MSTRTITPNYYSENEIENMFSDNGLPPLSKAAQTVTIIEKNGKSYSIEPITFFQVKEIENNNGNGNKKSLSSKINKTKKVNISQGENSLNDFGTIYDINGVPVNNSTLRDIANQTTLSSISPLKLNGNGNGNGNNHVYDEFYHENENNGQVDFRDEINAQFYKGDLQDQVNYLLSEKKTKIPQSNSFIPKSSTQRLHPVKTTVYNTSLPSSVYIPSITSTTTPAYSFPVKSVSVQRNTPIIRATGNPSAIVYTAQVASPSTSNPQISFPFQQRSKVSLTPVRSTIDRFLSTPNLNNENTLNDTNPIMEPGEPIYVLQ